MNSVKQQPAQQSFGLKAALLTLGVSITQNNKQKLTRAPDLSLNKNK